MPGKKKHFMVIPPSDKATALDFIVSAVSDDGLRHLLREPEPETGRIFVWEAVEELCKRDTSGNFLLDRETHERVLVKAHEKLFYFAMEALSKKNLVEVGVTPEGEWCFRLSAEGKNLMKKRKEKAGE